MSRFLTISFLILGLCLLPSFVKADLLLHLQFNEGAGDTVKAAVGKDGKLGNKSGANPKWVDGPSPAGLEGRFGKAIDLDGKTNFVEIPMDLSPQATDGAITISAWVKVHATALDAHSQTRQPVVMKGNSGEWEYALYIFDDFKLGFSVWNCGGSGVSEPSSTATLTKDKWHYVAGSFAAKVGSKAYIDGKLVTPDAPANANIPCDGKRNVFIGHREDGQFLSAAVDEVRIWNEALSAEKIASFMYVPVEPTGRLTATWGKIKAGY